MSPAITETLDLSGAQSQIPPEVMLINDIYSHFKCAIQDIGTLEMDELLKELCVNGVLKSEHQHLEAKGLTHILHMPLDFQIKWIRFILSHVQNGQLWLEQPILITKKMIYKITGLPMLVKEKMTKTIGQVELEKKTLSKWDGRGMTISCVTNMELKFRIHVITHNIYSLSRLNSMSCEAVDLAYKVVKNNLSLDLDELLLNQFNKNMESIRTSKNNPCKFGSLLTCIFFYVQIFFPSKGTIVWRKNVPIIYQINEYIAKIGENYESIMDNYFDAFKEKMNNRFRI